MQFWSLNGLTPYERARELQLELVEKRARDLIPDTFLFLEHEPVITRGRGLQFTGAPRERHMPLVTPLPKGMAFAESERGGDLTYHGPGQLVIYPICKLDGRSFGPNHDIAGFLRRFEQVFIDVIGEISHGRVQALARENATGVWVQAAGIAHARKVASMGIAVRRWVTYHGLAINCVNELSPFHLISPCGYSPEVMTRLVDLLEADSEEVTILLDWEHTGRADLEERLAQRLKSGHHAIRRFSVAEALTVAKSASVPASS